MKVTMLCGIQKSISTKLNKYHLKQGQINKLQIIHYKATIWNDVPVNCTVTQKSIQNVADSTNHFT